MTDDFKPTSRADVAKAISLLQQHAPHQVPLFQAVHDSVIALGHPTRDSPLPSGYLKRAGRPALVMIGDDDGSDTGPGGWDCHKRLASWARFAIVHASAGEVHHYQAAVLLTLRHKRVVLIETGTKHFQAWHELFDRAKVRTLNIVVPAGGMHPVPVRKGSMH